MKNFTRFIGISAAFLLLGFSAAQAQSVLCVDRDGSFYSENFTDCWPMFQDALDALDITYDYIEIEDPANNGPDATTMAAYDVVIWFTGETWQESQTMTTDDEFNLVLYTTINQGKLFLSAQDYLYDRYSNAGTLSAGSFPYDVLGLREVLQDVWQVILPDTSVVYGSAGSLADGMEFGVQDIFTTTARENLYIDLFMEFEGNPLYEMGFAGSDSVAGNQYDPGSGYRTVFSTVSFASIIQEDIRTTMMDKIIAWLMGTTEIKDPAMDKKEILVYPNPAKDFVTVGIDENIDRLVIFNGMGQQVYSHQVGDYKTRVDISSLETGMYMIQAHTASGIKTSRMIVE
ncbi:MAG: T9SS type A sorting domain-containing protein [Bacteroidales bacterium]